MMTTARALVGRVLRPLLKAVEGQPRPGPYNLPISGGWLPDGAPVNWWQAGLSLTTGERSAVVERCVAAYSETIASLSPATHWRRNDKGGKSRVENSALSRVLRRPNSYETASGFMLNLVRSLYLEGNAFALGLRNERFEITELHLMDSRQSSPFVVRNEDDGDAEVFYRLLGNSIVDGMFGNQQLIVPSRDVLHIRLHDSTRYPRPLRGETPLAAAMQNIALSSALAQQQIRFLLNEARPSAVLSTDLVLSRDEVQALRDRWNEQSKGLQQGGTPILTSGLTVVPWSTPAKDAQIAELAKISHEMIAHAFRVPLQLLNLGGAPFSSTEALMSFWLASGLGFTLNHVEQSFDRLFGLKGEPEEFTEFDTAALLRSAQKDRIEALVRGVQGGVYSPNEARAAEDLDAVPYGDEPRVQAQVIPLSAAASIPAAPTPLVPPSAPAASANYPRCRAARCQRPQGARQAPRTHCGGRQSSGVARAYYQENPCERAAAADLTR
jgi:HK97 family phage portal protein